MKDEQPFSFDDLKQFYGSAIWVRHPINRDVLFTEGILYLAARAKAMWLLDEIVLAQKTDQRLKDEEFQVWTLSVDRSSGVLRCDDGNKNVILEKVIEYTDFPEPGIRLYFTDNVIMLTSEY